MEVTEHEVWQRRVKEVRDKYEKKLKKDRRKERVSTIIRFLFGWALRPLRWYACLVVRGPHARHHRHTQLEGDDIGMVGLITFLGAGLVFGISYGLFQLFDWIF